MLAGDRFSMDFIPRIGMEALINYLGGDPDKAIIVGGIHNGQTTPAAFSDVGQLPDNLYVSGIKTREIQGNGYGQLRYDDTRAAQGIRSRIAISRSMCLATSSGMGDSPLIHRPTVRRSYPAYSAKVTWVQPRRASA
jgi:hypothetical protein